MTLPATTNPSLSLLMDPERFEHVQRVGKILAMSPLFPDHLRKGDRETAIANGVLVMNMAQRLNEDPLTVAQNIYFVGGKPGWSASYMIGKANQHGVFKNPISWDIKGEGDSLSVTAFAEMAGTGQRVSATADMAMAKAEGWTRNAKYKSMPETMLRYRSATALIRFYCPEVMIGIAMGTEHEMPMRDITPHDPTPPEHRTGRDPNAVLPDGPDEDGDLIDSDGVVTEAEPKARKKAEKKDEAEKNAEKKTEAAKKPEPEKNDETEDAAGDDSGDGDGTGDDDIDEDTAAAMRNIFEMVRSDLVDGADLGDVMDMYGAQIDAMEQRAPKLHADLVAEINKIKEERGDG